MPGRVHRQFRHRLSRQLAWRLRISSRQAGPNLLFRERGIPMPFPQLLLSKRQRPKTSCPFGPFRLLFGPLSLSRLLGTGRGLPGANTVWQLVAQFRVHQVELRQHGGRLHWAGMGHAESRHPPKFVCQFFFLSKALTPRSKLQS